jgi:hypothetical protein
VSRLTTKPQTYPCIEKNALDNDLLEAEFKGEELDRLIIIDHTQVDST